MAANVYVQCMTLAFGTAGSVLVDGVTVSLHPAGGGAAIDTGITGNAPNTTGSVSLGSRAVGTYEIRVTPQLGTGVVKDGSLHSIVVTAADEGTNVVFDVLIDSSGLPTATDVNFCRCSGTFMDSHGKPVDQLSIHFYESEIPELAYYSATNKTNAVIPKSQVVRTDNSGFASIDLLRDATYQVYMEGFENLSRAVTIPALNAAPLPDVLFPVVDGVEYTISGSLLSPQTLALTVGEEKELSLETVHRSGLRLDGLVAVTLTSDDEEAAIVGLAYSGSNTLTITAIATGTATLNVARTAPEEGMGISMSSFSALRGTLSVSVT